MEKTPERKGGVKGAGAVARTPESSAPWTPGARADAETSGKGKRGLARGLDTPESAKRFAVVSPVRAVRRMGRGGGGGFDSPARARAGRAGDAAAADVGAGYGTPPSSPRARGAEPACPATPIKARRTRGVYFAGEDAPGGDARTRPRGRVVRSLLEEFDAAARELDDMLEEKSENTMLRSLDDDFDPFDEPDA